MSPEQRSCVAEATLQADSASHANLALVSIWTRLLTLEYRESDYILIDRRVTLRRREILNCLSKKDRKMFEDHLIGSYGRWTKYVQSSDEEVQRIDRIYDRALFAWRALGTTVLTNTLLTQDALEGDEPLLLAAIEFKKWFFHSAFSNSYIGKDGRPYWPHVDSTITLIKKLSAWITYYGAFSVETEKPNTIDALPGSVTFGNQELRWFGGTLSMFIKPWLLEPNVLNVHALATMSGFGRALPCPSSDVSSVSANKTLEILTTPVVTPTFWLDAFKIASERVSSRMKKAPVVSHCSINATACFERNLDKGGTASYVVEQVNKLLNYRFDNYLDNIPIIPEVGYDLFGRKVYSETVSFTMGTRRRLASEGRPVKILDEIPTGGLQRPIIFGNICYRNGFRDPRVNNGNQWSLPNANPHGGFTYNRDIEDLLKSRLGPFYNETLGDVLALWASSAALQYGHFTDLLGNRLYPIGYEFYKNWNCTYSVLRDEADQNGHLEQFLDEETVPFMPLAIFAEPGIKVWVQSKNVPAKFMALEEPGWKARCLTKNRCFVVILQAILRHSLAESFISDIRVGLGLKSSYILWDFLKVIKGKKFDSSWYSISTDLSQATDRIPHDLLTAMWSGFLPSVGVNENHPLYSLKNMIMLKHDLFYDVRERNGTRYVEDRPHECGSFMGEPISFLGLSLYNLCVSEIAAFMVHNHYGVGETFPLEDFSSSGPIPTGYICIVGDDRYELTNLPGLFPLINYIYSSTNGAPSAGKNTVSPVHGVLAENHVYMDNGTLIYMDTIKAKLLTPSTRFHSDNRTSILGKGATLYLQLDWLSTTIPFKRSSAVTNARYIYTNMVINGFHPRDMKEALKLPLCMPPSAGGISFPTDFLSAKIYFGRNLDFIWWLLRDAPMEVFFEYALRIKDICSNTRRALKSDSYSAIWKKTMSSLIQSEKLEYSPVFDKDDQRKIYSLSSILDFVQENHPEIGCSKVTGRPHVVPSMELVLETYGFLPIESMLDLWERQSTFFKAFTEKVERPEHLSFHKYVKNLKRFWDTALVETSHIAMEKNNFSDFNQLHWHFNQRLKTFIHKDVCGGGKLSSGPTLFVRLARHDGVARTETGWEEVRSHAVSAYLAKVRTQAWEDENIVGDLVASATPEDSEESFVTAKESQLEIPVPHSEDVALLPAIK